MRRPDQHTTDILAADAELDSLRAHLRSIARTPLLAADRERDLPDRIERGDALAKRTATTKDARLPADGRQSEHRREWPTEAIEP